MAVTISHGPHPGGGKLEDGIGVLCGALEEQIAIGKPIEQLLAYLLKEAAQNKKALSRRAGSIH